MINKIMMPMLLLSFSVLPSALGQNGPGMPEFAQGLFPPHLIMQNQNEIGLEPSQREAIIKEMQALQSAVTPLQWEMKRIQGELKTKIETTPIDKDGTLKLLGELLDTEKKVKQTHFGALITIKGLLKPQQIQQLRQLRGQSHAKFPGRNFRKNAPDQGNGGV